MSQRRYLNDKSGAHPFDEEQRKSLPHIFFITVDMIPRESYDPDSPIRQYLHTPHLDRLMADGTRFTQAFSVSPLCGPSRASYLTGRYPYLTVNEERAHDGWEVALRGSDAIFPEYLKASGYVTKHVGKCHVGAAKFLEAFGEDDAPWDRWAAPLEDDDGYLAYLRHLGVQLPVWRDPVTGLCPDRCTPGNQYGGWMTQTGGDEFPEEATYSQYLARLAVEKLESALARRAGAGGPLYLQLDFFAPHQPFFVPTCYEERARELAEHVQLPASYCEAMGGAGHAWPRVYQFYLRTWGLDDEQTARRYMLMNFLQIEALDAAIGRFLQALDRHSLYEDAVIILAGDHGEMNCERGLIDKGAYGHPKVARVPLTVKLPSGEAGGRTVEEMVSLLDIAPTVFEIVGVTPTQRLDGHSLLPLLRGEPGRAHRPFIFECGWHVCPNPAISLFAELAAGRRFMYTYNLTSELDELYDLDDPHYRNLAAEPAYSRPKAEMIKRLAAFVEADPRWTCYWHTLRLDKYEDLEAVGGDFQMFRPDG